MSRTWAAGEEVLIHGSCGAFATCTGVKLLQARWDTWLPRITDKIAHHLSAVGAIDLGLHRIGNLMRSARQRWRQHKSISGAIRQAHGLQVPTCVVHMGFGILRN